MLKKKLTKEDIATITKVLPSQLKDEERQEIIDSVFGKLKEYVGSRIDELTLVIDKLDPDKSLDLIANQVQAKFAYTDLAMYIDVLHSQFVEKMTFERLQNAFNTFYGEIVGINSGVIIEGKESVSADISAETSSTNN